MKRGKVVIRNDIFCLLVNNSPMDWKVSKTVGLALVITAGGFAMPAAAESADWSLGLQPELELTSRLNEKLDIRFGVNGDDTLTEKHVREAEAAGLLDKPVVLSALVDWSITDNGFRLTGGAMYGDQIFSGNELNVGSSTSYSTRTYVGLGWDNQLDQQNRLGISLDLGLTFEALDDPSSTASNSFGSTNQSIFGQDFDGLGYEPSFSASLEYRF